MNRIYDKIVLVLGSKYFFGFIVFLFFLQAFWIAISFKILPYDENFHYPVIQIFAQQLSPFIYNQPAQYDYLGSLEGGGSATLYHYFMSFFYRIIEFFSSDYGVKVIGLRIINILLTLLGLILLNRLFKKVGFKQIFINISLLFYILIPIVPLTAAHINYDNLLLPLTVIFFIFSTNILLKRSFEWKDIAGFIIFGCLASLVKSTFLPIFFAGTIYIIVFALWRKGGYKKTLSELITSYKKTTKPYFYFVVAVSILSIAVFSGVYIKNVILYKTPTPSCQKVLSADRCSKNHLVKREEVYVASKYQRERDPLPTVMSGWPIRLSQQNGANAFSGYERIAPEIFRTTIYILAVASVLTSFYAWRSLNKNRAWYFLATMTVVMAAVLFLMNTSGYYKYHMYFANQPRYLLSVLPIFLVIAIASYSFALRRARWAKLVLLVTILLIFTQGGGIITYILHGSNISYWPNEKVINANQYLQRSIAPMVRGE